MDTREIQKQHGHGNIPLAAYLWILFHVFFAGGDRSHIVLQASRAGAAFTWSFLVKCVVMSLHHGDMGTWLL
jgi:hypothetical protein